MTDCTAMTGAQWLMQVGQAWAQADGSAAALSAALLKSVGGRAGQSTTAHRAFVEGVAELARYALEAPDIDQDAVAAEVEAVEVSRRIVRPILQHRIQSRLDKLDDQALGQPDCPRCQGMAESQGRPQRSWGSLVGVLELSRRYIHCVECQQGFWPSQKPVGLPLGDYTARAEEVCTMMATTVPYGMASKLLDKMCGLTVSVKAIEDMVSRRTQGAQELDTQEAQQCAPLDEQGLPVATQHRPSPPPPQAPQVAYLEMDGVIAMTRQPIAPEDLSEQEKQRLQQATEQGARGGKGQRYEIGGREIKNAVLYDGQDCAKESPPRGCLLHKRYVSHQGDWQAFAARLWVEVLRLGFDRARKLVVLSDGSEWIRSLCGWLPVTVLLILDLFHVKKRIWEVAHSLYGQDSDLAKQWAKVQCDRVEAGQAPQVIEGLKSRCPRREETKKLVAELHTYLSNNLDRMDYPAYRAQGLRVGSGAVESANYHVTGSRLKLQGMRWSPAGSAGMAVLRADMFNDRWERRTKEVLAAA